MRQDLNTLKRRPFLFPLLMPIAMMAIVVVVALWVFDARSTTVIIAVRHAELEQPATDPDPNLSLAGKERAARLARMLARLQTPRAIDVVMAAETRRSQQTVQPLAESLSLPTNVVTASVWESLADRVLREHQGEAVLVAADAKQLSQFLGELTDESIEIPEAEYDRLYIVFAPRLSRLRVLQLAY